MAYTRRNISTDLQANRAWTADAFSDLASIPARHGDVAYTTSGATWYMWLDTGIWVGLSLIATAIQSSPGGVTDNAIVRWDGSGGSALQDSDVIISDTGLLTIPGQIAFPATQSASSDANTLDDYEEGTWTPGVSFGGGTTGITYTTQVGGYIKIGRWVHAQARIDLSNKGSSTGQARVTGLPFTVANTTDFGTILVSTAANMSGLTSSISGYPEANTTTCILGHWSATGLGGLLETNFTNTSIIAITAIYLATA